LEPLPTLLSYPLSGTCSWYRHERGDTIPELYTKRDGLG
jgi:hypothetical protein